MIPPVLIDCLMCTHLEPAAYRVPQNLSVPTNVVTAADVTLSQLNLVLGLPTGL